ncbi:MAG: STAS domain-containing protein [Methylococcus sp.]|nr:MAG: STAS domain-containing protein [Methylococcus sp.]
MNDTNTHGITVIPVHRALILTLPSDLGFDRMEMVKQRVCQGMEIHAAKALILECSGVELMDRTEFDQIRGIANMVRLHGLTTYLVGLNPWIAGYLADQDVDLTGIHARRGLEEALEMLNGR